jgi:hypothetical protein
LIWRNAFENRPDQDHCHLRVPWLDDEEWYTWWGINYLGEIKV